MAIVRIDEVSLEDRVRDAEVIALGAVGDRAFIVHPGDTRGGLLARPFAFTDHEFVIQETWKGCSAPGETLWFRMPGGRLNDSTWTRIGGVPVFAKGQRIVAFLERGTNGLWAGVFGFDPIDGYATIEDGRAFGAFGMGKSSGAFAMKVRDAIAKDDVTPKRVGSGTLVVQVFGNWNHGSHFSGETEPIGHALIRIDQHAKSQPSDERGIFRFDGLEPGCHRIEIRAIGFKPASMRVEVKPGSADTLRINVGRSSVVKH